MNFRTFSVFCLIAGLMWIFVGAGSTRAAWSQPQAPTASSSLMFIENVGQFAEAVRYQVWGGSSTALLTDQAVWLLLNDPQHARQAAVRISFVGASSAAHIQPLRRLETVVNYFRGSDPSRWYTQVPVYAGVRYEALYPGLDLEITSQGGAWRWRWIPRTVGWSRAALLTRPQLQVDGAQHVEAVAGGLRLITAVGEVYFPLPTGTRVGVRLLDGTSFLVNTDQRSAGAPQNAPKAFQTNPEDLLFSTLLGGSAADSPASMALDASGNVYLAGKTESSDMPVTTGVYDTTYNQGGDAFVAKVQISGTQPSLAFLTFLGGSNFEEATDIAVAAGTSTYAYITGWTKSADFPTTAGALQKNLQGTSDAFFAQMDASGQLLYATLLGGTSSDYGTAVAVDGQQAAYLAGWTYSNDFSTTQGAFDPTPNGDADVYVAKLQVHSATNPITATLQYASYLGGSGFDSGTAIAVDGNGAAYVGGYTLSSDFPTQNAYDSLFQLEEGFVAKVAPDGSSLSYVTLLGGMLTEEVRDLAVDSTGAVYATGWTNSPDFPTTTGTFDTSQNSGDDIFVTKLAPSGSSAIYSTFIGGSGSDQALAVAVDGAGLAYITGWTDSTDFPIDLGAFDATPNGQEDGILLRLSADGSQLTYASYLGGSQLDEGHDVTVDAQGSVFVTGNTRSSDFPTVKPLDTTANGSEDAFLLLLGMQLKYTVHLPLVLR